MSPSGNTSQDPTLVPGGICSYSHQAVPHSSFLPVFIVPRSFCFSFSSIFFAIYLFLLVVPGVISGLLRTTSAVWSYAGVISGMVYTAPRPA